ncbi:MAG: biotin/lipoyl-containing protein [Bradyrhizobium sp.]
MPEFRITTEVAGRVCKLAVRTGTHVGEGEEVVVVEAMKMEIPATSPAAGIVKSILVGVDDLVGEGQLVAILET